MKKLVCCIAVVASMLSACAVTPTKEASPNDTPLIVGCYSAVPWLYSSCNIPSDGGDK